MKKWYMYSIIYILCLEQNVYLVDHLNNLVTENGNMDSIPKNDYLVGHLNNLVTENDNMVSIPKNDLVTENNNMVLIPKNDLVLNDDTLVSNDNTSNNGTNIIGSNCIDKILPNNLNMVANNDLGVTTNDLVFINNLNNDVSESFNLVSKSDNLAIKKDNLVTDSSNRVFEDIEMEANNDWDDITNKNYDNLVVAKNNMVTSTYDLGLNKINLVTTTKKIKKFNDNIIEAMNNIVNKITDNVNRYKMNNRTMIFYAHDIVSSGKKYIVSQMCSNQDKMQDEIFKTVGNDEVDFQIDMSRFVYNLTRSQQRMFGEILNHINNLYFAKTISPVIRLPNGYDDLRKLYLDSDLSIGKHIPIPEVKMIKSHSCVSILDCVADYLIRNDQEIADVDNWQSIIDDNDMCNNMSIFRSNRINEIVKDASNRLQNITIDQTLPVVPIFFTFWSDDFDPNKSIKANRQSVWIKTMTIFTLSGKGLKNKLTYPLSLSVKGAEHELVEEEFFKEIELLRSGKPTIMYSRSHHSFVYVHADIFCILNDQPEKRSNLQLGNGNSLLHARFGYIINIKQNVNSIRSCEICTASILDEGSNQNKLSKFKYEWRSGNCKKCTAWMYHSNSSLLHFLPENNFPIILFQNELVNGKLRPYKINRTNVVRGIHQVVDNIEKNKMKISEAREYLKYLGINKSGQTQIIQEKFEYKIPSTWYGNDDLSIYVEAPMHLLMLGVMKAVMIKVGSWIRLMNQTPNFLSLVKGKLRMIKKMNIEWCKILEYPRTEKTGGWVSENFVAMVRLCTWFYSILKNLPINEQYNDPTTNYTTWKLKECEKWLQVRGIVKNGKLNDLKLQIGDYFKNKNIPPIKKKNDIGISNIMDLIQSTQEMIKTMMSLETTKRDIKKLEALIRVYLIHYDRLDSGLRENLVPSWIQQFNMVCLLNVPSVMRKYGSMRNVWEGGKDGEAYLQPVKKNLKSGLVNQWQTWVLTNLLKEEIYENWKTIQKQKNADLRLYAKIYGNRKKAKESFTSGNPISGIIYENEFYICYRHRGEVKGNAIELSNETYKEYNLIYYSVEWTTKKIVISNDSNGYVGILLLPSHATELGTNDGSLYCYVRSDWSNKTE